MGAFGELLKVYWGFNSAPQEYVKPKKNTRLKLKYEEDEKEFLGFGLKERKELINLMGTYYKRNIYKHFMYYQDWLEFTDNGKIKWVDRLNEIYLKRQNNLS